MWSSGVQCSSPIKCLRAQVYTRLTERLGLSDHLLVLNVMLSKIATNLKVYGACDDVVTATLALFQVQHSLPWDVMPVLTEHLSAGKSFGHVASDSSPCCRLSVLLFETFGRLKHLNRAVCLPHSMDFSERCSEQALTV